MKKIIAHFDLALNRWELFLIGALLSAILLGAGLLAIDFAPVRPPEPAHDQATPTASRVNAISVPANSPTLIPPAATRASTAPAPITPAATSAPNPQAAPVPLNHPTFAPAQPCQACHAQIRNGKK